jgi:hypothetical protein
MDLDKRCPTCGNNWEEEMGNVVDRAVELVLELLTPANYGSVVESIYGPSISEGVKDIFIGQVEDVIQALSQMAAARLKEQRAVIVAGPASRRVN